MKPHKNSTFSYLFALISVLILLDPSMPGALGGVVVKAPGY